MKFGEQIQKEHFYSTLGTILRFCMSFRINIPDLPSAWGKAQVLWLRLEEDSRARLFSWAMGNILTEGSSYIKFL